MATTTTHPEGETMQDLTPRRARAKETAIAYASKVNASVVAYAHGVDDYAVADLRFADGRVERWLAPYDPAKLPPMELIPRI